jgi:hypothetical protein
VTLFINKTHRIKTSLFNYIKERLLSIDLYVDKYLCNTKISSYINIAKNLKGDVKILSYKIVGRTGKK